MNEVFELALRKLLPEAKYGGYRKCNFFDYNEEINEFITNDGFIIKIENDQDFTKEQKENLTEQLSLFMGSRIFLESESTAPIF
jgi:hypothetical protein